MLQVDELKTVNDGDGSDNGTGAEFSKVSFEPEQQTRVQELIDDAYKRAYAKAQKSRGTPEEVERLKKQLNSLKEDRKTAIILRSLSSHNVVDAEEVTELLRGRIKMDDGNCTVSGESGATVINSAGSPMSVDEYVALWLSDRPHHLRSTGGMGAGSQGALHGGTSRPRYDLADPTLWRRIPREDLDKLLKEGIEVQGSAGQTYSFKDVKNPFLEARKKKFKAVSSNG